MSKLSPTVMLECQNLTLSAGTGIATYARNLSREAKSAGFHTAALYGINRSRLSRNAALSEIQLFDAAEPKKFNPEEMLSEAVQFWHRDPLGVFARPVRSQGIVIGAEQALFDGTFDDIRVVPHLVKRARQHFYRYGSLLPIRNIPDVDILHTTHVVPLRAKKAATICTIHDIIPLRLPYTTLGDKRYFYNLVKKIVSTVDHIVTVSERSKLDIMELFDVPEERISNTYQSVSIEPKFLAMPESQVANDLETIYGLPYKGYYLFAGAIEPKKNVSRMIDAYVASGSKRPLVLAGGLGWQFEGDVKRMNDETFETYVMEQGRIRKEKSVRHLNYVPRMNLLKLIKGARALIFPSIYEGFGLPVLEAMLLGTAVVTSNTSSLPEVAGDAAILVNPTDTDAISTAIRQIDHDEAMLAELGRLGPSQAARFSPEIYRKRLSSLYQPFI